MAAKYEEVLTDRTKDLLREYCEKQKYKPATAKEVRYMVNIVCRHLGIPFEEI